MQASSLPVAMVVQVSATANAGVGGGTVLQSLDGAVVFDQLSVTGPPGACYRHSHIALHCAAT